MRNVLVCGPVPPPVHGMSVATRALTQKLSDRAGVTIEILNTSPGSLHKTLRYHARKIAAILRSLIWIATRGSADCVLYLPVENGLGICYSLMIAASAKSKGMPLVLHHHSMAYLRRPWRIARLLVRCAGPSAVHVIICEAAGNSLKQCYPRVRSVLPLSNAFLLPPPESSIRASTGTLRVGHLGNLSRAKGIDLVLDTVRGAARRGLRVQLDVAGPVSDSRAAEDLARFEREFPGTLTCHGLLADAGKARFFDSLDVFLFPSRLPEIEGIVNLEAMRSGVVPIAFAHGCIASNFACGGGVCVEPSDDFAARAVDCLLAWNADRDALNEARSAVWRRYGELWRRAQAQAHEVLDAFMKLSAQVG